MVYISLSLLQGTEPYKAGHEHDHDSKEAQDTGKLIILDHTGKFWIETLHCFLI